MSFLLGVVLRLLTRNWSYDRKVYPILSIQAESMLTSIDKMLKEPNSFNITNTYQIHRLEQAAVTLRLYLSTKATPHYTNGEYILKEVLRDIA